VFSQHSHRAERPGVAPGCNESLATPQIHSPSDKPIIAEQRDNAFIATAYAIVVNLDGSIIPQSRSNPANEMLTEGL
jgi:hypothetical protein